MRFGTGGVTLLAALLLAMGCTNSVISAKHDLFPASGEKDYARVYLLRPMAERSRGVADNAIDIEIARKKLADLAQGEYVLVYLKPAETEIVTRNLTNLTAKPMPVEVWRARHFNFEAGHDYFILIKQDYEEFRGIYYLPEAIDRERAQAFAAQLTAAGPLAKQHPLIAAQ